MPSSEPVADGQMFRRAVETPGGPARVWVHPARDRLRGTLVLGHGAGRGADTADLMTLADRLPELGIAVVRVDQPWVVAGRRVAVAPPRLDEAWVAAVPAAVRLSGKPSADAGTALFVGGRSAGARVACRTANQLGAAGVVALAFPLHPPGRPDRSRAAELIDAGVPTLVIQGDRDGFGSAAEVAGALTDQTRTAISVVPVPHADHALRVGGQAPITSGEALDLITEATGRWLLARRRSFSRAGP